MLGPGSHETEHFSFVRISEDVKADALRPANPPLLTGLEVFEKVVACFEAIQISTKRQSCFSAAVTSAIMVRWMLLKNTCSKQSTLKG